MVGCYTMVSFAVPYSRQRDQNPHTESPKESIANTHTYTHTHLAGHLEDLEFGISPFGLPLGRNEGMEKKMEAVT